LTDSGHYILPTDHEQTARVAKETKKDIVDRQEARDKASAMSSHRRILAWEKDVRTKNATQLAILAYFLVHNYTTK
jgi:hypothetical protein